MAEDEESFEDEIDPRIKGELDTLNQSTDEINRLETELNDCRDKFKSSLASATLKLQKLTKKYGKAIERARPFYTTKAELAQARLALQRAVNNFNRANGVHRAAKETIALAESRLSEFDDKKVDMAWQEVLNLQTMRFMEAETDKRRSEALHERATKKFEFLEKKSQAQRKKHKNSTSKAKPYFELKELLEIDLQKKRQKVDELQREIETAKKNYSQAFHNLESISTEIHEKRRQSKKAIEMLGVRRLEEGKDDNNEAGKLPSNPLDLDLVGHNTYDDIDELEADLDDFDFENEGEEELSSGSESDTASDASTPRTKRKNFQLKRSNTAPERKFVQSSISKRDQSRGALKRAPHVIKRATSVNTATRDRPTSLSNLEDEDVTGAFSPSLHDITPIEEDTAEGDRPRDREDIIEQDEATYRRLHGTNIDNDIRHKPVNHSKKSLPAPDDFDIFDELC